jgi:hypothetical protein
MERRLHQWFLTQRSRHIPISYEIIAAKAMPSSCMFRFMANTILLPAEGGLPILEPVMAYDH